MITMPVSLARIGAVAFVLGCLAGPTVAQQTIYSCEMDDGSVVLETEQVSKKCQKVSETAAPPKPPVAAAAPPAPAAAASAAKQPAAPVAKPPAAAPGQPVSAVAKTSGSLVVKAPLPPVKVPPKRTVAETYHDLQVKQAETALRADDPDHGIVGAAPTTNAARRYLMTDREHYQKAIGASPQAAPAQK